IEGPSVFEHVWRDDGQGYDIFERLELAEDERAVRPGARKRNVKVIASGFCREAAFAGWPRTAVGRNPIAELRGRADELAVLSSRSIFLPDAVNQKSHTLLLNLHRSSFRLLRRISPRAMDQNRSRC